MVRQLAISGDPSGSFGYEREQIIESKICQNGYAPHRREVFLTNQLRPELFLFLGRMCHTITISTFPEEKAVPRRSAQIRLVDVVV